MNTDHQTESNAPHDIDFLELWNVLWGGRKTIAIVVVFFALLSIIYALTRTNIYRAEAVLAAAETRQSSSPLAAQLGGAASLVGVNIGQQGNEQISTTIAIIESRDFITKLIADYNLLPYLFASSWDSSERKSTFDAGVYDEKTGVWRDASAIPTDSQAYRRFSSIFSISRVPGSALIRMSIELPDPVLAAQWVNLIVQEINDHVKQHDLDEATNAIEYLTTQLASTQLVEMQRVFYQLIESQTRIIMLADVRDEYVFQVIDQATTPDQAISPNRSMICIVGVLLGFLLSCAYLIVLNLVGIPSRPKLP